MNREIAERILSIADSLVSGPEGCEETVLSPLQELEKGILLSLLRRVDGESSVQPYDAPEGQDAAPKPTGNYEERADGSVLCRECQVDCVITWDEAGTAQGYRCTIGHKLAKALRPD